MKYDSIIIGGGLAGLVCGIKCCKQGLDCAIISAGLSALSFSSGSIDLLGRDDANQIVYSPFEALPGFLAERPDHPYARIGPETIRESLEFFAGETASEGLKLYANGLHNHFHVTTLGTVKPTYFSQESVFSEEVKETFARNPKIAVLNFQGFRDFFPALAAANLPRHSLFKQAEIITGEIKLPPIESGKTIYELRSIDIGRLFEKGIHLDSIVSQIGELAQGAAFVGLPAVIGLKNLDIIKSLREMTGLLIYEIPTLPPSILGLRLDEALKSRFAALGGVFIAGDQVIGGEIQDGRLNHIHTQYYGKTRLEAQAFVLATGSFFSGGLISRFDQMSEPVFGLQMDCTKPRSSWSSKSFFHPDSHPFLEFGVKTDRNLNPVDRFGRTVENLFAAGAVLSNYNPIKEGTGGGAAIGAGYAAALKITELCRKKNDD